MNDREHRGPWYLLTGVILGVILGLAYAWLVQPVEYVDTSPASLRETFKDRYRALIASAYMANGDIVRARARLELLEDEDIYRSLTEQAQRTLAEQGTSDEARALGLLAIAIGQGVPDPSLGSNTNVQPTSMEVSPFSVSTASSTPSPVPTDTSTLAPTQTPPATSTATATNEEVTDSTVTATSEADLAPENEGTPTETPIPRPTNTPTLTPTPTRTPGMPFVMVDSKRVCDQALSAPLFQVFVENASGDPASGVEVIATWAQGEERFFTGLKPEKGMGYADFTPLPRITYSLRIGEGGEPVEGLTALSCPNPLGGSFWGAWVFTFVQP